jgi:hypothetical protein
MLITQRVHHVTQTHGIWQEYTMTLPTNRPHLLSVHRTFVVQLYTETDVEAGRVAGRVEHVVSGRATHFPSLEALLAFIASVLRGEHASSC